MAGPHNVKDGFSWSARLHLAQIALDHFVANGATQIPAAFHPSIKLKNAKLIFEELQKVRNKCNVAAELVGGGEKRRAGCRGRNRATVYFTLVTCPSLRV